MVTPGTFGYLIGKKKRIMHVTDDADLLWQILVREIYVLMKYYKSKELLKDAFEKIKVVKSNKNPTNLQQEQCKMFTNFALTQEKEKEKEKEQGWNKILHFCQSSYINLLEAGYLIKEDQDQESGLTFMLDFNKGEVRYYYKKNTNNNNIKILQSATIEEIMDYEEMPIKSYTDIMSEMREQFDTYYTAFKKIQNEKEKILELIKDAKAQNAINITDKLQTLLEEQLLEERTLNLSRRMFYNRLKALELIEEG
uniref:Uncharacterized protein n=1 Tax=viral metagenome TaxID=1070528 RepID=A0A6C0IDQ7_9ZZZZ